MPEAPPVTTTMRRRQRLLGRGAELRLFERPVFDVEDVGLGNARVGAQPFGVGDHGHRRLGEVGRDLRVLRGVAEAEQAEARHQHDARDRVELLLGGHELAVVAHEIGVIVGREFFQRGPGVLGEGLELAGFGRGRDEGHVLSADRVVGRHRPLLAVTRDLRAVHEGQDLRARTEFEHEALPGLAAAVCCRQRHQPAQDRRDFGRGRDGLGQRRAGEDLARFPCEPLFGQRHQVDHADIGLFGRRPHREDAVLQQDQAFDVGIGVADLAALLGERKSRHDIGHERCALAEDVARQRLAVGLVGERQHGVGMGVVDELVRQEGVRAAASRPTDWATLNRAGCSAGRSPCPRR